PSPDECFGVAPEEGPESLSFDVGPSLELCAAWCGEVREKLAGIESHDRLRVAARARREQPIAIRVEIGNDRQRVAAGDQSAIAESLADVPEGFAKGMLGRFRFEVAPEQVD